MSMTVYRNFLREALFKLGKRIEIWENAGRGNWKTTKQASPGNLQAVEEELGSQFDGAPVILAVKVSAKSSEARNVGVCFADASVRELGVSEFLDNDLYSNFESFIIQRGVKECLIQVDKSGKDVEIQKLKAILDSCGITISERQASDFATKDIDQDMERILKDEKAAFSHTSMKLAMGSAAALIKYLGILHDSTNFGQYQLYEHDLENYMKLDAAALKALNLMPGPRDGAKTMSLYGLLNHCKTPVGSRLLSQWLKQPLMSMEEIVKRQQLVEAFVEDTELRQTMQEEHLRSIPDLYRLVKRFHRNLANLEDVVRAYQVVIRLPGFIGTLEGVMDEQYRDPLDEAYTIKLRDYSNSLSKLAEMVETTVDLDALDNHEFIIKPEFDENLRTIRKKLDRLRISMDEEHKSASRDLGQEVDKKLFLENHKVHGWCMRLTRTEASAIRNKSKYQECSTQKNGVFFTTQKLAQYRREFDQLSENYNRTQTSLVAEVVNVARSYCGVIEQLAGILAHLDVIISFAHCSVHAPTSYVRPKMHPRGQGNTILKEARHPCMEMQDDIQFITNDVSLIRGTSEFLIITGPNSKRSFPLAKSFLRGHSHKLYFSSKQTELFIALDSLMRMLILTKCVLVGGKSTYIRQIGVIALMAQVGCFVPCSEAELTIFDCILARVGASDSQLKGVSTFMAEMLETANILKSATSESLIIIDELGRGTSTYDGFGLAWAISEHIVREIGCFSMFATHFHELTALVESFPQVQNLHVVAHIDDNGKAKREVTLLYKVEEGICDQSFGIHVAELVRFPEKVVNMAKRKADELEDFTSKHEGNQVKYGKEDVEEGSALLKEVLLQWKAECEGKGLSSEEMIGKMREIVKGDEQLLANPFFKSIKAL